MTALPRVLLAAPASGQGKTTVSVGVMAALTARGTTVAPAKVGPDFIDPGYHALATGRPGRNLDPWLQGEDLLVPLLLHGSRTPAPADVTVIEGVMGLFDGRLGTEGFASSAHVATATRTPVVLVVDISSASRSVAATIHGLRTFDPRLEVAGVILNKAGSERHATEVRRACERIGVTVLGTFPRDIGVSVPSRHLGLVPAEERDSARATLDRLAEQTTAHVDLDALLDIAAAAAPLDAHPWTPPTRAHDGPRPVVAVAGGRAFTFRYAETEEVLRAQGLDPVVFDPIRDTELPSGTRALYLGGGFPEVHARSLAANTRLLTHLHDAVQAGLPTVAECAGMLYLLDAVDGHRFAGAVPASATMSPRLTLGYREAEVTEPTLLAAEGTVVRGHEFHRTRTTPDAGGSPAWSIAGRSEGFSLDPAGTGTPTVHASYLHTHWAGFPHLAERFADTVHRGVAGAIPPPRPVEVHPTGPTAVSSAVPADHHGDQELEDGLVDFAVNVRAALPPAALRTNLESALHGIGRYPDVRMARSAIAAHHGVDEAQVLVTNGAAEAFTLLARGIAPAHPTVVHPQFGEPDAAFARAGLAAQHVILDETTGLGSALLGTTTDCIVVGNPTNPTGRLHRRADLLALRTPERVVVVDEAFMDLVPGERESVIGPDMSGLLVIRSLTKTWSLAGLRAGYVVGDASLVADLARQQPHWSVNALAAAAVVEVLSPAMQRLVAGWIEDNELWRAHLTRGLEALGCRTLPSAAPFVLARVGRGVHAALREQGYATRRCDTFPGLDDSWIRLAVRDPLTVDGLLRALAEARRATGSAS